jgi:hypothetical protein
LQFQHYRQAKVEGGSLHPIDPKWRQAISCAGEIAPSISSMSLWIASSLLVTA